MTRLCSLPVFTLAVFTACGGVTPGESEGGASLPLAAIRCESSSECAVRPASCCGACGEPTRGDAVALRADAVFDYGREVCKDGAGCPACGRTPDPTLLATCQQGRCTLVDLLDDPSTACAADDACYVRAAACCECGASTDVLSVVALSTASGPSYETLVCDAAQACAACAPVYPDVFVACVDGHCRIVAGD